MFKYVFTPITGINLRFNYIDLESKQVEINDLQSQSLVAQISEKSIQTLSASSIKTAIVEPAAKTEMRKYIKQLLSEELESQQIKEKLSIVNFDLNEN